MVVLPLTDKTPRKVAPYCGSLVASYSWLNLLVDGALCLCNTERQIVRLTATPPRKRVRRWHIKATSLRTIRTPLGRRLELTGDLFIPHDPPSKKIHFPLSNTHSKFTNDCFPARGILFFGVLIPRISPYVGLSKFPIITCRSSVP